MSDFLSASYFVAPNDRLAAMTFGNLRYVSAASRQCRDCQFFTGNLGDFEAGCGSS
jgi:hypothetical protein